MISEIIAFFKNLFGLNRPKTGISSIDKFIQLIYWAEGTFKKANPYAVTYAYTFTISDFSDHPANLGWGGVKLAPQVCRNAGIASGNCVSTAAGAGQFVKATWNRLKSKIGLKDFGPAEQNRAMIELLKECGAYDRVLKGDIVAAIRLAAPVWASLPGNSYNQGSKKMDDLINYYNSL